MAVPFVVVTKSTVAGLFVLPVRTKLITAAPRPVSSLTEYVEDEKLTAQSSLIIVSTAPAWFPRAGPPVGCGLDKCRKTVRSGLTRKSSVIGIPTLATTSPIGNARLVTTAV